MEIIRTGTVALAAVAMMWIGHDAMASSQVTPPVQAVQMIAPPAEASICEVKCPGYVEPDTSYHPAPRFLYETPVIPTQGVVTVYVAAPVSNAPAKAGKASAQPKAAKASTAKAPKAPSSTSKGSTSKTSAPSTTTTTKQSTSTRTSATSTTTTSSSSTSTTRKG